MVEKIFVHSEDMLNLISEYQFFIAETFLDFIYIILQLVFNNSQKFINSDMAKWQISFVI